MLTSDQFEDDLLEPGFLLSGRYRINRFLGSGGMGCVYLASDQLNGDAQLAIKVLHPTYAHDPQLTRYFMREVKLLHLIKHPNVVRLHEVGRDHELFFFTMEYAGGTTLDKSGLQGVIEPDHFIEIVAQLAEGLAAIHDAQIIHRDLKPGNIIIVNDGLLKIADFGVARHCSSAITTTDQIVGSIEYMAPETWDNGPLSPGVDFYSMGVVLYELLTGVVPFPGDDPAVVMLAHVERQQTPVSLLRHDVPEWFDSLIDCLLAKSPEDRPRNARAVIEFVRNPMVRKRMKGPRKRGRLFEHADSGAQFVYEHGVTNSESSNRVKALTTYAVAKTRGTVLYVFAQDMSNEPALKASEQAAYTIASKAFQRDGSVTGTSLQSAFTAAHDAVLRKHKNANTGPEPRVVVLALALFHDRAVVAYCGEIDLYLFSGSQMFRLSEPERVSKTLKLSQAEEFWCLGSNADLHIEKYLLARTLNEGDRFAFCAPLASDVIPPGEIGAIIVHAPLQDGVESVAEIVAARSSQNIMCGTVHLSLIEEAVYNADRLPPGVFELELSSKRGIIQAPLADTEPPPSSSAHLAAGSQGGSTSRYPVVKKDEPEEDTAVMEGPDSNGRLIELRSPYEGVIFSSMPSTKEIKEHERVFMHQWEQLAPATMPGSDMPSGRSTPTVQDEARIHRTLKILVILSVTLLIITIIAVGVAVKVKYPELFPALPGLETFQSLGASFGQPAAPAEAAGRTPEDPFSELSTLIGSSALALQSLQSVQKGDIPSADELKNTRFSAQELRSRFPAVTVLERAPASFPLDLLGRYSSKEKLNEIQATISEKQQTESKLAALALELSVLEKMQDKKPKAISNTGQPAPYSPAEELSKAQASVSELTGVEAALKRMLSAELPRLQEWTVHTASLNNNETASVASALSGSAASAEKITKDSLRPRVVRRVGQSLVNALRIASVLSIVRKEQLIRKDKVHVLQKLARGEQSDVYTNHSELLSEKTSLETRLGSLRAQIPDENEHYLSALALVIH